MKLFNRKHKSTRPVLATGHPWGQAPFGLVEAGGSSLRRALWWRQVTLRGRAIRAAVAQTLKQGR